MFPFSVSYQASQLRVIGISISRPRPLSLVASFTLSFALLLRYPLSDFAIKVRLDAAAPNFVSCVDGDGKRGREHAPKRSERASTDENGDDEDCLDGADTVNYNI